MDKVLPFGLRSAPKYSQPWLVHYNGFFTITDLHYLDDYILVAKDHQSALAQNETLVRTFQTFGVPLEFSKLEGPETCLTFLGIE